MRSFSLSSGEMGQNLVAGTIHHHAPVLQDQGAVGPGTGERDIEMITP